MWALFFMLLFSLFYNDEAHHAELVSASPYSQGIAGQARNDV
jgi:hypothetical protein